MGQKSIRNSEESARQVPSFTPDIIVLSPRDSLEPHAGAIALFAALGVPSCISSGHDALLRGSASLIDVVRSVNQRHSDSGRAMLLTLRYCEKPIISISLNGPEAACASMIPFPGGTLSLNRFMVERDFGSNGRHLELLVVVQPPALSLLEQELTARFPCDLPHMSSPILTAYPHDLLVTDEGWAVGGYVAQITTLRLRQKWSSEGKIHSSQVAGISNNKQSQTNLDLRLPALDLLERYRDRQMR